MNSGEAWVLAESLCERLVGFVALSLLLIQVSRGLTVYRTDLWTPPLRHHFIPSFGVKARPQGTDTALTTSALAWVPVCSAPHPAPGSLPILQPSDLRLRTLGKPTARGPRECEAGREVILMAKAGHPPTQALVCFTTCKSPYSFLMLTVKYIHYNKS